MLEYLGGVVVVYVLCWFVGGRSQVSAAVAACVVAPEVLRALPSFVTLQGYGYLDGGSPQGVQAGLVTYLLYALVPPAATRAIVQLPSGSRAGACLIVVGLGVANWVLEVRPPWMEGYARAADGFAWSRSVVASDIDPAGAAPSLHVGLPLVVAFFARSPVWSVVALVQSGAVLVTGEHWVTDVVHTVAAVLGMGVIYERRGQRRTVRPGKVDGDGAGGVQGAPEESRPPGAHEPAESLATRATRRED